MSGLRDSPDVALWPASTVETAAVAAGPKRHLVLIRQPGWQSVEDWQAIAGHVRDIDPSIRVFLVDANQRNSYSRRQAATLPTLIVSPGPLRIFRPVRGKIYHGRQIPKVGQLQLLADAGVPVPRTVVMTPGMRLDPADWGEFVIVKPTDPFTSSYGRGIQLIRTARVRHIRPEDYPAGHPGRLGPMIVQQFINTGDRISLYRVLTLFGEPLYAQLNFGAEKRVDLGAGDEAIERSIIATQAIAKQKGFANDPDVIALARAAHAAMPDVPLKGTDIIREQSTGRLYVLEVNPVGNTWHFSSDFLAEARRQNGPEFELQRLRQFDAFRTAARVLVERTNAEAS